MKTRFDSHNVHILMERGQCSYIVSDTHFGTALANFDVFRVWATRTLKSGDKLILNGDILQGWHYRKGKAGRKLFALLEILVVRGVDVVYLVGNHDDDKWFNNQVWFNGERGRIRYGSSALLVYEIRAGESYCLTIYHGHHLIHNEKWWKRTVSLVWAKVQYIIGRDGSMWIDGLERKQARAHVLMTEHAKQWLDQFKGRFNMGLVMGHSHQAIQVIMDHPSKRYYNTGSWLGNQKDFPVLVIQTGRYPEFQSIKNTQLEA